MAGCTQDGIYDKFAEAVTEKVKKLKQGPGLDPASTLGPLINTAAVERVRILPQLSTHIDKKEASRFLLMSSLRQGCLICAHDSAPEALTSVRTLTDALCVVGIWSLTGGRSEGVTEAIMVGGECVYLPVCAGTRACG